MTPSRDQLREALVAAGGAHHDYEQGALGGRRDAHWSGFYAAYALGRLGDFASPTALAGWLEAAPEADDWAEAAAAFVLARLSRHCRSGEVTARSDRRERLGSVER